jgi:hypothetical protein
MPHLETVASPAIFVIFLACVLGAGFMIRFLVALTLDERTMHLECAHRRAGLHYPAESPLLSPPMLAAGKGTHRFSASRGRHWTCRGKGLISQPNAVIAQADAAYDRRMQNMQDIVFVAATIAFFLISIAYVKFCDRIH